jgi:hypothetical protein
LRTQEDWRLRCLHVRADGLQNRVTEVDASFVWLPGFKPKDFVDDGAVLRVREKRRGMSKRLARVKDLDDRIQA